MRSEKRKALTCRNFPMTFDPTRPYNDLPPLPPPVDLESKVVLRECITANRALASLKVVGNLIPNQTILINAIPLQEAQASSEIENIVTTGDALYRADLLPGNPSDPHTKEVLHYREALYHAYRKIEEGHPITTALLHSICNDIIRSEVQIRMFGPGKIVNKTTGEVVYLAPDGEVLGEKLRNLEEYISKGNTLDPLIQLALIHYQFEAIHPFEDGNGRTGRILNILFLVDKGLLDIPVLYLSRYIIEHKNEYYQLLRSVTEHGSWEEWVLFMLTAIEVTALSTYYKIWGIKKLLDETVEKCRGELPSTVYSKELIELIFVQPYSKVSTVVEAGLAKRQTAARYLQELEKIGVLKSEKIGKERIYFNQGLMELLSRR